MTETGRSQHVPTERIVDDYKVRGVRFICVQCSCGMGIDAQPHLIAAAFARHVSAPENASSQT